MSIVFYCNFCGGAATKDRGLAQGEGMSHINAFQRFQLGVRVALGLPVSLHLLTRIATSLPVHRTQLQLDSLTYRHESGSIFRIDFRNPTHKDC